MQVSSVMKVIVCSIRETRVQDRYQKSNAMPMPPVKDSKSVTSMAFAKSHCCAQAKLIVWVNVTALRIVARMRVPTITHVGSVVAVRKVAVFNSAAWKIDNVQAYKPVPTSENAQK